MRVEVQRTGGFAGRVVRWSVVVEDLPPSTGEEVLQLLEAARNWPADAAADGADDCASRDGGPGPVPGPGADRFQWRLQTSGLSEDVDLVFAEPAPPPARRLVDLVREAPPTAAPD